MPGKILSFNVEEGMQIPEDSIVGSVDATNIDLQQQQVEASIHALNEKTANVNPQVELLQNQLAAKQLDDINSQIDVVKKSMAVTQQQINVKKNDIATQNRSILSEAEPLRKRVAQLEDQQQRANIVNPVNGT